MKMEVGAIPSIGALEEYFSYDSDEYYKSLQMGLPALYYEGRENHQNGKLETVWRKEEWWSTCRYTKKKIGGITNENNRASKQNS